jgi:PAS domain S-box-containing protein
MTDITMPKTVLLVEDEVLIAMNETQILKRHGFNVVTVYHGKEAIEEVENRTIDLILMDIDLGAGKMSGTEAAKAILQSRELPIVFLTSHAEKEVVEQVKGITRYGYVLKHSSEFVIIEAIQMAFELFEANRMVKEKESRYQYMFDYNQSGVAVYEAVDSGNDFVFVDFNRTAEKIEGVKKDALVGKRVTEVFPGAADFGLIEVMRKVWETGSTETLEDAFYQDDQRSGWRRSIVYKMPTGELVAVYEDVTEERQIRTDLMEAKRIVNNSPVVICRWKNEEGWPAEYVSENVEHVFGYSPEELLSGFVPFESLIYPPDLPRVQNELRSCSRDPATSQFAHEPYRIIKKNGAVCWVEDHTTTVRDSAGSVVQYEGVLIDVSEKKQSRDELRYRTKELECLYAISKLVVQRGITLQRILEKTVDLIPLHFGAHGPVTVCLTVADSEYRSENFTPEGSKKESPIYVHDEKIGELQLFYPKDHEELYDETLLPEMDLFVTTITERLGRIIERFETEERLHITLSSIGDAVITTDMQGKISSMNRVAQTLTGYTMDEALSRPLSDVFQIVNSMTGEKVPNPVDTVLQTNEIVSLSNHTKLISGKGKEFYIADSAAPIRKENGETKGVVLIFRDETAKYKQEQKLRESEEQFRRLFNNMAQGALYLDRKGKVIAANRAAEEILGLSSGELLNLTPRDSRWKAIREDGSPFPNETYPGLTALESGKAVERKIMGVYHPDRNEYVWISASAYPEYRNGESTPFRVFITFEDITHSKKSEIEQKEHKRFLQTVFDSIQEFISVQDKDLNILQVNHRVQELYKDTNRLRGKKCYEAYHGRSEPCSACPTLKVLETEEIQKGILRVQQTPDEIRLFEVYAYPIKNAKGDITSVIEYARDITEQKKNEEELVRTKEQLQKMFQTLPEGFVTVNVEGEITYANEAAGRILEVYQDKITGSYYNDRKWRQIDEDGNPYPLEALPLAVALREKREVFDLVHGIVAPDGETKWLSVNSAPLFDAEGGLSGAIASFRDISEKKQMERALRESEEQFRSISEQIAEMVFITDAEGVITYVSPASIRLFGHLPSEMKGNNFTKFLSEESIQVALNAFKATADAAEYTKNLQLRMKRKDGSLFWGQLNAKSYSWQYMHGTIGSIRDISDRIEIEENLQQTIKEKELLMRELTHRTKNNLMMISSLINLKNSTVGDELDLSDLVSQIDTIRIAYDRLNQSEDITYVDVKKYIEEVLFSIFAFCNIDVKLEKKIEVETLPTKTAVPLGLIINELATNAIKYGFTPEEEARFSVELKKEKGNGRYVLIIFNTGKAFPEEIDIKNPVTLGLELIDALVSQVEGTIDLKRNPSPTFTIRFQVEDE